MNEQITKKKHKKATKKKNQNKSILRKLKNKPCHLAISSNFKNNISYNDNNNNKTNKMQKYEKQKKNRNNIVNNFNML